MLKVMGIKARHVIGLAALGGLAWYLKDKNLTHVIANGVLDFPARQQNPSQLLKALEDTQVQLARKFRDLPDTPENRKQLGHIIAIERWGTHRLKVFNGQDFQMDSSHEYYPADDASWEDLMNQFAEVRKETLREGQEALANGKDQKVEHNQLGALTAAGWLKYLNYHAYLEATKFKKADPVSSESQSPGLQS